MKRLKICTAIALVALTWTSSAWALRYKVVEQPLVRVTGSQVTSQTTALNSVGGSTVIEYWNTGGVTAEVCRTSRCERMPLLPHHGRNPMSYASDINDAGQIVGTTSERGVDRAVLLKDGVLTNLGALADGDGVESFAAGLNAEGEVVGHSRIAAGDDTHRAFHWKEGVMTALPTLGGSFGFATAINDAGQIVGGAGTANGRQHAFMYRDGQITDLGAMGGKFSVAYAANAHGHVVGETDVPDSRHRIGFRYSNGVMASLGTMFGGDYTSARGINDAGEIVGIANIAPVNKHRYVGFLLNNELHDLNDLLRASDRQLYQIEQALDINNQGDIAGRAIRKNDGARVAVILKRID
jgi:probable HAF family extracellular repeat protein